MATTTSMTEADWQTVQSIAQQVNFPAERVSLARKRLMAEPSRHGAPYTLVVGRPDAGIELVFARHFAPEVAEKLKESGERPLVLGQKPSEILPPFTSWPVLPLASLPEGHVLALRIGRRPDPGLLAQLGGLGYLDQLILVTRLGGPLHEQERDIARAFVPLAATVRVLIVGLPGEEPAADELAEVSAYAFAQMRQAGFRGGRCRSAEVWFSGGPARPGTIPDLAKQFILDREGFHAAHDEMARDAAAKLLADLRTHAGAAKAAPAAVVPEDEQSRLTKEFGTYLVELGRELDRQIAARAGSTTESLRTYALDALRGWGAFSGIEGHWLKYVDRLRPGIQAGLLGEAQAALALLEFDPGSTPAAPTTASSPAADRLLVEAKRTGVALVLGIGAYATVSSLLNRSSAGDPASSILSGLAATLAGLAAFFTGSILGYALAGRFFKPSSPNIPEARDTRPAAVHGWQQIERRLTAWLSGQLAASPRTPLAELQELAQRLGIPENAP